MICKDFDKCEYWFCQTYGICLLHFHSLSRRERRAILGIKELIMLDREERKREFPSLRRTLASKRNHAILEKTGGRCWLCGKPIMTDHEFTKDHKIPLSKGGTSELKNLFPAHKRCNSLKADRIIETSEEFLAIFADSIFH